MRIGHVTYSYKPVIGGQEAYIADLFELFEKAGHDQRVYQRDNGNRDEEVIPLTGFFDFLPGMVAFDLALMLRRKMLRSEHVLMVNYPEVFPALVWHKHAIVISHGSTWTRAGARTNDIRKRQAEFAWRTAPVFVANDTFVLREMGMDIEPRSRVFKEVAPRRWFVPNCVDVNKLASSVYQRPWATDDPVILVPRNLTRSRGVDVAVSALGCMRRIRSDVKMVIVGDVISGVKESQDFATELHGLAASLDLCDSLIFAGRVERARMPDYYGAAALTLIPTRYSEGTSLAALESMACATPVLATAVEGLLDLPVRYVEPEPEAIAEAALAMLDDRLRLGKAQQEAVALVYNLENWRSCWLNILDQAAGVKR